MLQAGRLGPLVSIVVSTYNEENNIRHCLASIKDQAYRDIEIIVVDSLKSTDRTKDIALEFTDKVFAFGWERSTQRNYGLLKKASGKYLIFIDADMILSWRTVEEAVGYLENHPKTAALYIPEIILGNSFWCQVRRFERSFYDGTVIDGLRAVRRNFLDKIGGFDIQLFAGEDWDLDKRIKKIGAIGILCSYDWEEINRRLKQIDYRDKNWTTKICHLTDQPLIYHNEADFSLKKYLFKKNYYIGGLDKYVAKWGSNDPDVKKQLGLTYRYFLVFWEGEKWRRLLRHPLLAGGMYLMRFLLGISFLFQKIVKKCPR